MDMNIITTKAPLGTTYLQAHPRYERYQPEVIDWHGQTCYLFLVDVLDPFNWRTGKAELIVDVRFVSGKMADGSWHEMFFEEAGVFATLGVWTHLRDRSDVEIPRFEVLHLLTDYHWSGVLAKGEYMLEYEDVERHIDLMNGDRCRGCETKIVDNKCDCMEWHDV